MCQYGHGVAQCVTLSTALSAWRQGALTAYWRGCQDRTLGPISMAPEEDNLPALYLTVRGVPLGVLRAGCSGRTGGAGVDGFGAAAGSEARAAFEGLRLDILLSTGSSSSTTRGAVKGVVTGAGDTRFGGETFSAAASDLRLRGVALDDDAVGSSTARASD